MIDVKTLSRLPASFRFRRNTHPIESIRTEIGEICVDDGIVRIADAAWVENVPPLPVRVPVGTYTVYTYQWHHAGGPINVCMIASFRKPLLAVPRRLTVNTDIRPDLTDGIIVDSAKVAIQASNTLTVAAGLGDGYYPVFASFNLGIYLQSVILDFMLWEYSASRYILLPGQEMDEYGIVRTGTPNGHSR